ncbi:bacterioferritin-associated ferredoxin [Litoribrevibacter euphylliae]|uniref:Bacterioferritin-associated ferredoxin n=1 Tax=Litoribrevibacter euphylliae TaxID=1834034 RepID=A0ABV7HGH9_9GAMM
MFVCLCNQVTTHDIEQVMAEGNLSFEQVQEELGVANCCGQCEDYARELISEKASEQNSDLFYEAA